ncbi:hypothetical protein T265_04364 [Opisthorchis viverrini]|uniref:Uncharacterized protein n=1 Tax=Opisthorchis viverrini TaxID=6198 RepID=A0A075A009_OPIVI|nr:hypothetical protein T265_04364 [Opisthorchis viverrini]KER28900.1 hypothetical protein T265_04364 [Opisthorchis viverrini]
MPPGGSTRAGILPGCPSLDRGSRVPNVGFEPRTFRSINSCSNHLGYLAPSKATRLMTSHERRCGITVLLAVTWLCMGWDTARASRSRRKGDQGSCPKPVTQKPDRKVANSALQFLKSTTHVLTANLEDQDTVLVRPPTIDQPGMRGSECRTNTSQYSSWATEANKPSHHGEAQSLREGVSIKRAFNLNSQIKLSTRSANQSSPSCWTGKQSDLLADRTQLMLLGRSSA